jgi:mono/diheme cytochrome c family protein
MPGSLFPGTGGEPGRAPVASGGVTGAGTGGQGGVSPIVGFCAPDPITDGEPIAVAFADETTVLVQIREPAELLILRQMSGGNGTTVTVPLSSASRANTGHELFHANSGGGLACASCHPEGHDDGRIWNFQCEGPRRTQDPSGGLVGTAPYHWSGDLPDFTALVQEVYVRRMSGPVLNDAQANALQSWLNTVPELPPLHPSGDSQVAHGKVLFESPSVGCVACHSGPAYTNNMTVSVGTGAPFQVPALHGVGWRAPYMHNGCAATLLARFTDPKCGGGDLHGVTSNLSDADRADLIAYLQSL